MYQLIIMLDEPFTGLPAVSCYSHAKDRDHTSASTAHHYAIASEKLTLIINNTSLAVSRNIIHTNRSTQQSKHRNHKVGHRFSLLLFLFLNSCLC
jgi:hypothetical protein